MKIVIIGSTGMLGSTMKNYMISKGHDVKTVDRKNIDLSSCSYESLYVSIGYINNIDLIVNCAGLIPQRNGVDETDMIKVNSIIPRWISKISKNIGCNFIHVTTDCVFNGSKGNYIESDNHDSGNVYGMSKSLGESDSYTIIRTSIIGEENNNKLSLLEWVKSNKYGEINGYLDHIWNGVTCLQLSKIIEEIHIKDIYWKGVRHIFSNKVNKYELSKLINDIYDLNIKIKPVEVGKVDRSMSSIYDMGFNIPTIEEQIKETKKFHYER